MKGLGIGNWTAQSDLLTYSRGAKQEVLFLAAMSVTEIVDTEKSIAFGCAWKRKSGLCLGGEGQSRGRVHLDRKMSRQA